MSLPAEFHNPLAYVLQVGLLALVGALLPAAFRIRLPRVLLLYWRLLLLFCLLFPLAAPRRAVTIQPAIEPAVLQMPAQETGAPAQTGAGGTVVPWAAGAWRTVVLLYAAGCALRLLTLGLGLLKLALVRRRAHRAGTLPAGVGSISAALGVKAEVLISPELAGPATYGFLNPAILLPQRFEAMESEGQVSILCHELIHVRRRDWLSALGEQLILAIFWCHPAVWWLVRRIELTREQVVDREVLTLNIDRRQYLKSLLYTVGDQAALLSATLFLRRQHLKERVVLLLEEVHMSRVRLAVSLVSMALLFAGGALFAVVSFPLTGVPATPAAATMQAPGPPSANSVNAVMEAQAPPAKPPAPVQPSARTASRNEAAFKARPQKVVPIAPGKPAAPDNPSAGISPVSGMVVDQDGTLIGGVDIQVSDPATRKVLATGATSERGTFSLSIPFQGAAEFTLSGEGFQKAVITGVMLQANRPTTLRATLKIGETAETILVKAGSEASPARANQDEPLGIIGGARPDSRAFSGTLSGVRPDGRAVPARASAKQFPVYPPEAIRQEIESVVVLEVAIAAEGEVANVRVLKGHDLFNDAAMAAIRQWRYRPAMLNGKARESRATVTFDFRLK